MRLMENIEVSLEALLLNKVRFFLTMLGVTIGVAAVILLVSIGEGARSYISKELTGIGTNIIVITPGKTTASGGFHPPSAGTTRKLTYEDAIALKRRAWALSDSVPIVLGTGRVKYQNVGRDTTVIGVTPEFERVRNLHIEIGSFINQADVDINRKVVALGRKVKRELFGETNPLGRMVTISDVRYRIVGVMERKGVTLGVDIDDVVFIPVTSAQELFDTDALFEILSSAKTKEDLDLAIKQIKDMLIKRHGREDFTIFTQDAMLSAMDTILTIMTAALGGIAGISLIVGGIGIMNIMLVSVRERTKEIGVRKAVGARKGDILSQFLIEATILSGLGGIIGVLLGTGISSFLPSILSFLPTKVTVWSVALAFSFSVAVGIFFGVYPARKASLLDPIVALRYE